MLPGPEDAHILKVSVAIAELAKGFKGASFYPPGHPSLVQLIGRIISLLEEIPLPADGLEIGVMKNSLFCGNAPLPNPNKSLIDLNRDLYLRRVSKLIFLPGIQAGELTAFLSVVGKEPQAIQDEGGLEKILPRENISHIWINKVDYEAMTDLLKNDELPEELPPEDERVRSVEDPQAEPEQAVADPSSVDALLERLAREDSPSGYRGHLVELSGRLAEERPARKVEYTARAFSIFMRHVRQPPGGSSEIAEMAARAIKEMASEEMVMHYLSALRDRSRGDRQETENILVMVQERAVRPLLDALAVDKDLLVRRSIVDILIRIGRPAVPIILEHLTDAEWFTVRNMITILGNMGMPDLAPHIVGTLAYPDPRVRKEAIKALARLDHPASISALGELCFNADVSVAMAATTALSLKQDPESVLALYRRAVRKNVFYPDYGFSHEAVDSLAVIGTDEALTALEEIGRMRVPWQSRRFRDLRFHVLQAISRIPGSRSREALRRHLTDEDRAMRDETKRLLRSIEP